MERTLVILKPDSLVRGLVGEITGRLECKGLKMVGCKMTLLSDEILKVHYAHLADRPFYGRIAEFMQSAPVLVQCWEGVSAVEVVRELSGITNGRQARPGTIRGDLSMSVQCNLVHASDSIEAAESEVRRFFREEELFSFDTPLTLVLYSSDEQA